MGTLPWRIINFYLMSRDRARMIIARFCFCIFNYVTNKKQNENSCTKYYVCEYRKVSCNEDYSVSWNCDRRHDTLIQIERKKKRNSWYETNSVDVIRLQLHSNYQREERTVNWKFIDLLRVFFLRKLVCLLSMETFCYFWSYALIRDTIHSKSTSTLYV